MPGLAAKPVIDILVTVEDPDDESTLVAAFESAGYMNEYADAKTELVKAIITRRDTSRN